ncbi:PHA/PHB synthase family protein [Duganella radicis]|uniref:Alpha/beta fold hydrolase n=1 Tax=Duganella radicis TaxID=551988 RepID=A0A6L6PBJ5_9BURK|nr:alpha/beta fold hydrolase [Duganella radicis]MTV36334.1 alpha/beta fold hydrolase [Duganella radicis]
MIAKGFDLHQIPEQGRVTIIDATFIREFHVKAAPLSASDASPSFIAPAPPHNRQVLDIFLRSQIARLTLGISPAAMWLAFQDWWQHLAVSPGKCTELAGDGYRSLFDATPATVVEADGRFAGAGWRGWPFCHYVQGFKRLERLWEQATSEVAGVAPHHAQVVAFTARQLLDMWAPSNFLWTNPEVLRAAVESHGGSLIDGMLNWRNDLCRQWAPPGSVLSEPPGQRYVPGIDVACTPGEVIYRNDLIELLQYAPQTDKVCREPVLIVPSWIMKYYILDLSRHNSLVQYLVRHGHTVLMISWRNPGAQDRALGMEDYLWHGLFAALGQASQVSGGAPVHAAGYCLGGTLLSIAAAAIASGEYPACVKLASLTLLAAQTDFSEPGELGLFIDDSELAFLDALMWDQGYLDGKQMAASFQLLHARDLVWSRMMREYLLGERSAPNDLLAWNADTTRLPFRMHSEYLHGLFLRNDLAEGRYLAGGKPVALSDIRTPMFVVATERDHVSPWQSVYKINLLCGAPIEFVLASGGHNAGIVSEPGHAHRSYRSLPARSPSSGYRSPQEWLDSAERSDGSWWRHWQQWLSRHSEQVLIGPPSMGQGRTLGPAPGLYVTSGGADVRH